MVQKKSITLKDVAHEAGVCYQTVSKVINNKADWVSDKTRTRVLDVVEKLGYEPNYTASTLRSGKRMTIGIINGAFLRDIRNIDLARYYSGIGQRSEEAGYYMTFMPQCCRLGNVEFHPRLRKAVNSRVVDGLIMFVFSHLHQTFHQQTLPVFLEGDVPLVVVQVNSARYDCPTVGYSIESAGYLSAKHLLEKGYRDIACITRDNPYGKEYYQGYLHALQQASVTKHDPITIDTLTTFEGGRQLATEQLKNKSLHEAYIIGRDAVALGFVHTLKLANIKVPEDVAVVGCDNLIDESLHHPFLTTIDRKFEDHGYRAADMLFNLLENKIHPPLTRDIVQPELVIRDTT